MKIEKKKPRGNEANSNANKSKQSKNSTDGKEQRVFMSMLHGWKGHRFDAEKELSDHCLNSSVSAIQKKTGVPIQRKWVTVYSRFGEVRVKEYWINRKDAKAYLRKQRAI